MCCKQSSKSKASKLRHRITIQRQSQELDDANQYLDEWSTVVTVWCSIEPLRGNEYLRAKSLIEANTIHRITLRYRSGILPTDRILFDGRYLYISSIVNVDEGNQWLEIMATETVQ